MAGEFYRSILRGHISQIRPLRTGHYHTLRLLIKVADRGEANSLPESVAIALRKCT